MSLKRVLPPAHRRAALDPETRLDINAELLAGVRELEAEREGTPRRRPPVAGVEDLNFAVDASALPRMPGAAGGPTRVHRKTERTDDERRELAEVRERFQRERPTREDLLASGDYETKAGPKRKAPTTRNQTNEETAR